MFNVFVLVCFSCVACFHSQEFIRITLFLCCCFSHKTKWSSCLHLVVLLPFLFCCFVLSLFFFVFSFLSKKRPPKTRTRQKPPKTEMQKKRTKKNQLAPLCSQIVFFNFLGWAKTFHVLAENTIKIVVSALFQKGKRPKINKIVELKICPRLRWKSVQLCCAT